ncbi:MAG: preprotein translocase subunit SecE [Actinobacteria bacterium]|nr:preprotein translocase subunit SecE [Actinomycetota bacterium]
MVQSDKSAKATNKSPKATNKSAAKPGVFSRLGRYLKDVRTELRRVIWPSRKDVLNSSVIVIVTLLFFMAFTAIIDNLASFVFIDVLAGIGR